MPFLFYIKQSEGKNGQIHEKKLICNFCSKHFSPALIHNCTTAPKKFTSFDYNLESSVNVKVDFHIYNKSHVVQVVNLLEGGLGIIHLTLKIVQSSFVVKWLWSYTDK